ncbi:MAG: RNA methyltransferase [Hyphomicrobiaceae bacterium]|nr:RNA methyltransferase [Hyphomicrobiaceae bacterium]
MTGGDGHSSDEHRKKGHQAPVREPLAVTSLQNERIKAIRALEMRKERKATGLFVAEGASIIVTARDNGWQPVTLLGLASSLESGVGRGLVQWARAANADVLAVNEAVLGKIAAKENPQSLLCVFRQRLAPPPQVRDMAKGDVWLVLEEVRDPGNLGTILRTLDAVGAKGVILVGPSCDPWSRECVRATMGSLFTVPIARMERPQFLDWLKQWPGDIVATHLAAAADFRTVSYREPVLVLMGSEGPGLSDELTATATRRVKIPMAGRLDSLNLAVATALVLYQVRGPYLRIES